MDCRYRYQQHRVPDRYRHRDRDRDRDQYRDKGSHRQRQRQRGLTQWRLSYWI